MTDNVLVGLTILSWGLSNVAIAQLSHQRGEDASANSGIAIVCFFGAAIVFTAGVFAP